MARNGVKQRWPETWKGIVPRTSPAPTSFARSHSNVSIFGTSTTARECTIDLNALTGLRFDANSGMLCS